MKKITFLLLATSVMISCKNIDAYNRHIDTEISPKKLKKDVRFVEKNLFKLHPDTDWYISKELLRDKFDSLRNTITSPMKPNDFFFKISPIIAEVRQGHMGIYPLTYTFSKEQKKKYKRSTHPLSGYEYIYKDNKLIISKNKRKDKKDEFIQIGTEVLSINGIKPKELFDKYRKTYSSDGFNETFINPYFARRANTYYNAELKFVDSVKMELKCADSVFFHTSYRIFKEKTKSKKDTLSKVKKDSLATVKKDSLAALKKKNDTIAKPILSKKEQKALKKKETEENLIKHKIKRWKGYDAENKTYAKELTYPVENDSTIAVLKLTTFSEGSAKIYDTIFKEIKSKNVENLIIDLRGNTGGRLDDIYKLSKYLNKDDYYFVDPAIVTKKTFAFTMARGKSLAFKTLLFPFWGTFATIRTFQTKKEDGIWKNYSKSAKLTEPNENAFTQKLYVLTDGLTFSAGAIIASHLHGIEGTTFVGEETGGTFNGTVAGQMPQLELPHSKLKWRLGLMSIKPSYKTKEEGYGVKPDVEIIPTIDDIIEKNDTGLDWILKDIKAKSTSHSSNDTI